MGLNAMVVFLVAVSCALNLLLARLKTHPCIVCITESVIDVMVCFFRELALFPRG